MTVRDANEIAATWRDITRIAEAIAGGIPGWQDRLAEMTDGGFPRTGTGSGSSGQSDPTGNQVDDVGNRRRDPAKRAERDLLAVTRKIYNEALRAWVVYDSVANTQVPPIRIGEPSCELCDRVEGHWCASHCSVEVTERTNRRDSQRKIKLCHWCYRFQRPVERGGRGRLPTAAEVADHAAGRRVRVGA